MVMSFLRIMICLFFGYTNIAFPVNMIHLEGPSSLLMCIYPAHTKGGGGVYALRLKSAVLESKNTSVVHY